MGKHWVQASLVAVMLAGGCAGSTSTLVPLPTPSPSPSAVPSVLSAAPASSDAPAASVASAPPPASEAAVFEDRVQPGLAGSTIKTIACGKKRCRAGSEVCTLKSEPYEWVCRPPTTNDSSFYGCDDASDCAAPLACCRSFASADEIFSCAKPNEDCAALPCTEPDGTKCPRGQHCSDGYCTTDHRATCSGGKQCPKEAPYCAWSSAPACINVDAAEAAANTLYDDGAQVSGVYACTKPSDCGGHQCCTSMSYAEKLTNCFHRCDGLNGMLLCTRDSDCRERAAQWCGDNARCRRAVRCVAPTPEGPSNLPPWMKVCRALDWE